MKRKPFYLLLGYFCYRFPAAGCKIWPAFDQTEQKRYNLLRHVSEGVSDKSPTQIVYVDPSDITYCEKSFDFDRMGGRVIGGDWDRSLNKFVENDVFQCLKERYLNGRDWNDIEYVHKCIEAVRDGQTVWQNCTTVAEIWEHCADIDELHQSIEENGILEPIKLLEKGTPVRPYNVPKLNIGRDGRLILNNDGTHRTALAKILNVEKMPVWIAVRHEDWQEIRDQITADKSVSPEYVNHPDLEDLTSS